MKKNAIGVAKAVGSGLLIFLGFYYLMGLAVCLLSPEGSNYANALALACLTLTIATRFAFAGFEDKKDVYMAGAGVAMFLFTAGFVQVYNLVS